MTAIEGWKTSVLPSLLRLIKSGGTPDTSRSAFYGGDIPFVSIEDMTASNRHLSSTIKTLTDEGLKHSNAWIVPANSILYSIYATLGLPRINTIPVTTNQAILALINDPQKINRDYLYYWFEYIRHSVFNYSAQTTQSNLSASIVRSFIVDHPIDLLEQTKIAEILSTVDRAIEQTEALIAKQQCIKTGLMQDLLTRGIDEHGNLRSEQTHKFKDSPLGKIPVEWEVELLDSLALRGSGHTPNKRKPDYWNGGIKWVSLADSYRLDQVMITETDKEISTLGIKYSSAVLHPKGTVILSRDAGVGKSAILGTDMAVSQHFMAWRCKPAKLDNYYLYYWLQRDKPKFEGIASGSTIVTIGLQFFREYVIAAPKEVEEQKKISNILSNADSSLKRSAADLSKLMRLKTALMQDLLTGKKPVTALLNRPEVIAS